MDYESRIVWTLFQSLLLLVAGAFITRARIAASTPPVEPAIQDAGPRLGSALPPPAKLVAAPKPAATLPPKFASHRVSLTDDQFFLDKFSRGPHYDCVIAGDSRAMVGVSPGEMKNRLKSQRIFNFGFRGACLSGDYLDAVSALLDPTSPHRSIVLGISPLSLTTANEASNGFEKVKRLRPADRFQIRTMDRELSTFRPLLDPELADMNFVYYDDGWMTTDRQPNRRIVTDLHTRYRNSTLSPRIVGDLFSHVREWRAKGIAVYAFRLPTDPEVDQLEAVTTGFNESEFAAQFEEAGGRWLRIDRSGLVWQDLHHLVTSSALIFSRRLGETIAALTPREPVPSVRSVAEGLRGRR